MKFKAIQNLFYLTSFWYFLHLKLKVQFNQNNYIYDIKSEKNVYENRTVNKKNYHKNLISDSLGKTNL